jgi:hypothetical protein
MLTPGGLEKIELRAISQGRSLRKLGASLQKNIHKFEDPDAIFCMSQLYEIIGELYSQVTELTFHIRDYHIRLMLEEKFKSTKDFDNQD